VLVCTRRCAYVCASVPLQMCRCCVCFGRVCTCICLHLRLRSLPFPCLFFCLALLSSCHFLPLACVSGDVYLSSLLQTICNAPSSVTCFCRFLFVSAFFLFPFFRYRVYNKKFQRSCWWSHPVQKVIQQAYALWD
jgi:hypothetical protein